MQGDGEMVDVGKNNQKFTFEFVKSFFEEKGCTLVSTEYIGTHKKLNYICKCGTPRNLSFNDFKKQKHGCRVCNGLEKYTQEEVELYFKENGCELLSIYNNANDKLKYICECGNPSEITFWDFRQNKRCWDCGINKRIESQKHDYEYVRDYFEEQGCILLSDTYESVHKSLSYICECGNESKIAFADFQNDKRCWDCGRSKLADFHRHPYEFIENYFKENNCILLSKTYDNAHQSLEYICECSNESTITFDKFSSGQRCQECGNQKIGDLKRGIPRPEFRGENNPSWNPDLTDEERQVKRNYPEYREWVVKVFTRDNWTCQCCGKRGKGNLNAHHKDGYHWCKDRRIAVDNGATLCDDCHNEFHDSYGWKNNTEDQYIKFMSTKLVLN